MDKKIITALVLLGLFATMSVGVLVSESMDNKVETTVTTTNPIIHSVNVIDYSDGSYDIIRGVNE